MYGWHAVMVTLPQGSQSTSEWNENCCLVGPLVGPGATNQSAAAALRERMRGSKRASPPADGEGAEKKVKLSDGSSAPGGPSDSQLAATEAVASTDAAAASTDAPPAASTVDAPTSAAPTSAAATDDRGSAGAASGADANAEAAKAEAGGTSVGMGEGVAPAAVKVESDVGGEVKAEEDAALNGADVAVGEDDDVNTVVGRLAPVSSPADADARALDHPIPARAHCRARAVRLDALLALLVVDGNGEINLSFVKATSAGSSPMLAKRMSVRQRTHSESIFLSWVQGVDNSFCGGNFR